MTIHRGRAAFLLLACLLAGCAPSEVESDYLRQRARLLRQNLGIRELIAEAERGSLVPTDRFLIGLDEKVVEDVFRSQLPLSRPVGKRFVVQLEQAEVSFRDKFGVIMIDGKLHRAASPDRKTAVRIYGGLDAVSFDPTTGLMSIDIAIDHIELLRAGFLEGIIGRGGKRFLAQRGRELLQDAIPKLEVPVALTQNIRIPAVHEGGIELDSLAVPLNLSVERVLAAAGKLWVTLDAEVGRVTGGEEGVGVAIRKKRKGTPPPSPDTSGRSSGSPASEPDGRGGGG